MTSNRTRKPRTAAKPAAPKATPTPTEVIEQTKADIKEQAEQAKADAKVTAPKPAPANCGCGCGAPTITVKARFLSGHDARFAGQVGRGEVEPSPTQQALLDASPALAAKVEKVRLTTARKAAVKASREVAKAAAKKAFDEAMATATATA